MNKKKLYENIMTSIAKEVKKVLNENLNSEKQIIYFSDLFDWIESKGGIDYILDNFGDSDIPFDEYTDDMDIYDPRVLPDEIIGAFEDINYLVSEGKCKTMEELREEFANEVTVNDYHL